MGKHPPTPLGWASPSPRYAAQALPTRGRGTPRTAPKDGRANAWPRHPGLDVTENDPNKVKLKTLVSVVSPLEVAAGRLHEMLVFDSNGVLTSVNTNPSIPCGNAFNFSMTALSTWGQNSTLAVSYTHLTLPTTPYV